MPYFYRIDQKLKLVLSIAGGIVTKGDVLRHQDQLLADPEFDPNFSELIDLTLVTGSEATATDVREVADRTIFSPASRRAVIVDSEEVYGISRMFETFRELKGERGIRVFRSLEAGLDWIARKDESI